MRQVLLTGLTPPHYGKSLTHYGYTTHSEGITGHFEDGTTALGSLLVGAEGLNSRTARQLLGAAGGPNDMKSRLLGGKTVIAPGLIERLHPHIQTGISVVQDPAADGNLLFMEVMRFPPGGPGDYIYWVLVGDGGLFCPNGLVDHAHGTDAREIVNCLTHDWHESTSAIFDQALDSDLALTRITIAHVNGIPTWETDRRVTIIGDAAHPVPPTATGANTALRDAATLVKALISGSRDESGGWTAETIRAYEDEMRGYANSHDIE